MSKYFTKLRKVPTPLEFDDEDFYNDPEVVAINDIIYKDKNTSWIGKYPAHRSVFVVYPRDVEVILGLPPHLALQFLIQIREQMSIIGKQFVTPMQFCKYTGIDSEIVKDFMYES